MLYVTMRKVRVCAKRVVAMQQAANKAGQSHTLGIFRVFIKQCLFQLNASDCNTPAKIFQPRNYAST
jgi:hypothetical protein